MIGMLPSQKSQQPQLFTVQRLHRWLTMFLAADVELATLPVNLMPAQPSRLTYSQPVTIHEQNQSVIAFGMPPRLTSRLEQQIYFVRSQVFPRSKVSIFWFGRRHKTTLPKMSVGAIDGWQPPVIYINAINIVPCRKSDIFSEVSALSQRAPKKK
jgi:hypothetical protein